MKREAFGHAKFRLVARDLKIPVFAAYGLMESIWNTTALRFPRGDIGRLSNEEIAAEIEGYEADADQLVDVLVGRRLLDRDEEHRLIVHDWPQHADDTVHWKLARADQTFADGTESKRRKRRSGPDDDGELPCPSRCDTNIPPRSDKVRHSQTTSTFDGLPSPSPSPSPSHDVETTCSTDSTVAASGGAASGEVGSSSALDDPAKAADQKRSRRGALSHFVPEDFALTRERIAYAAQHRLDSEVAAYEFGKFRDHEFKDAHSDWDRAWRRWVRTAAERTAAPRASPVPHRALNAAETSVSNAKRLVEEARRGAS